MPSPEYFLDLARQLDAAKHGTKGGLITEASKICGSRSAVYTGLQQHAGWTSGRKKRADTGKSKITREQAMKTSAYIQACNRKNGKQILPLNEAVDDLKANGLLPHSVSVSTVRRALDSYGISPTQMRHPAPVKQLRTPHPNHTHQIDPSVCTLWFFNRGHFEWQSEHEFYKNKPENVDAASEGRIWRYVLTDHTSGYIDVHYIQAKGEGFGNYFDALMYFWGRKDSTPFHGVPHYLMSDRIGAMRKTEMRSLLKALEVTHLVAQGARAKGQVEGANNIVETHFAYRLRGIQVRDINHLNKLASDWCAHFNQTKKHKRHGMSRTECWAKLIKQEHIRLLPAREICLLAAEPVGKQRTVSPNMTIEFATKLGKHNYSVRHIKGINVGNKVLVQPHPFEYPSVWISVTDRDGHTERHIVQPVQCDATGFDQSAALIGDEHHENVPDTPREVARKNMQKQAYNTDKLGEADKLRKQNAPVFQGQIDTMKTVKDAPQVEHLPRRGVDIKPAIDMPRNSPMDSLSRISRQLGRPLTIAEGDELRNIHPQGCTDAEIEALVSQWSGTPKLQVVG